MNKIPPKKLRWLTVDPGRQYIGSFRPIDSESWFSGNNDSENKKK